MNRLDALALIGGAVTPGALPFMARGNNVADAYRRVANYTARILKGAKPADLPVDRAVKFELVVNLKAAKAIGLALPHSLLSRADEVID
jgi:putative tryptophan/tyrosine transport system substrate-binding protein